MPQPTAPPPPAGQLQALASVPASEPGTWTAISALLRAACSRSNTCGLMFGPEEHGLPESASPAASSRCSACRSRGRRHRDAHRRMDAVGAGRRPAQADFLCTLNAVDGTCDACLEQPQCLMTPHADLSSIAGEAAGCLAERAIASRTSPGPRITLAGLLPSIGGRHRPHVGELGHFLRSSWVIRWLAWRETTRDVRILRPHVSTGEDTACPARWADVRGTSSSNVCCTIRGSGRSGGSMPRWIGGQLGVADGEDVAVPVVGPRRRRAGPRSGPTPGSAARIRRRWGGQKTLQEGVRMLLHARFRLGSVDPVVMIARRAGGLSRAELAEKPASQQPQQQSGPRLHAHPPAVAACSTPTVARRRRRRTTGPAAAGPPAAAQLLLRRRLCEKNGVTRWPTPRR